MAMNEYFDSISKRQSPSWSSLAQLVKVREYQSQGRRFNSSKNTKNRGLESTWI